MANFNVPTADQVSPANHEIFASLNQKLGFVPNLYAYYAHNDTALADYLQFQQRKTTLKAREKEAINLVVSERNGCTYCLAAHTTIGKMNGFSDDEILEIRSGVASFDARIDAIVRLTARILDTNGKLSDTDKEEISSLTDAEIVDVAIAIGSKVISNYLHNMAGFAVDFPAAPSLVQEDVTA